MTAVADELRAPSAVVSLPKHLRAKLRTYVLGAFMLECLTLFVVAALAWQLRGGISPTIRAAVGYGAYNNVLSSAAQIGLVVGLWVVVLVAMRAYATQNFAVGYGEFQIIATASALTLGATGFTAFVAQLDLSRGFLFFLFVIGVPLLLLVRYVERSYLSHLRTRGKMRRRAIIVGSAKAVDELHGVLRRESWTGYNVIGTCLPETTVDDASPDLPALGFIGDVRRVVTEEAADTVIVAGGGYSSSQDLRRLAWGLEGLQVDMLVAPALTDVAGPRVRVRNVAGLPLVHVAEPSIDEARGFWKRAFDVVVACFGLLLISPLFLAIAAAIKFCDGGPVFFRQDRVGVLGSRFQMVKFRSMVTDAEAALDRLHEQNECDETLFKMRRDPRITPVGRFLRKFSLDELPQLINVVRGEMSLVGPRPALPAEVDAYADHVGRRLLVPPGMTGLWQVSGRSDLSWEESVRLDLYYVDNWSMVGDLFIMLKTVKAVALSSGAY